MSIKELNLTPEQQQSLATELVRILEEALGEAEFANANKMDTPDYLDAFCRNELRTKTRTRLTAIIEREFK